MTINHFGNHKGAFSAQIHCARDDITSLEVIINTTILIGNRLVITHWCKTTFIDGGIKYIRVKGARGKIEAKSHENEYVFNHDLLYERIPFATAFIVLTLTGRLQLYIRFFAAIKLRAPM
ncbi:hypothetical protein AB6H26_05145 [Providencia hangzhouensis]|uniref:hypothetical protein n=1 Tax=Providencia TaxID=586 RepID=UPI0012B51B63|nr:hypothetical protein [Providencia rettgeri]MTC74961.1 hypothetical protein [Providencia sp. wls1919]